MDIAEAKARKSGVDLAEENNAPKTAAVIADKNSCFNDIFNSAVDEIGAPAFLEALKKGPRIWSQMAVHLETEMGEQRQTLINNLAATADPHAARPGEPIFRFELFQGAAVSGIVRINKTGDYRNLFKNQVYTFNPADQGIAPGTEMRFNFGIEDDVLIGLAPAQQTFPFDPNSNKIAYYASWGIAPSQQFAFENHPGAHS
ncbi:hypothetical protein GRI43_00485 [Altererythrobacter luteolus]|uniref:Uncharacterized protein n=1 Tax=Pontixanthobacter luteolus TaxID=295089 RepID=A0A6I4UVW7_9SPHN|nr:hypothetical protein [Pontixanthobacter luteolus]MXP45868.1 hypothetical protein [Pontixanthobacter luteolus]